MFKVKVKTDITLVYVLYGSFPEGKAAGSWSWPFTSV